MFDWIHTHRDEYALEKMARALQVSKSSYYRWLKGAETARQRVDREVSLKIKDLYQVSRKRYGSPRIHAALRHQGIRVSQKRVARLMRDMGLRVTKPRKWVKTTDSNHSRPVAENLLNRHFTVDGPDQVWAGDITYLATKEGWLYLAVVLDLYSRKVIGWSMSETMTTQLVLDAFNDAVHQRSIAPGLLFHSDRGSQYASHAFQQRLKGLKCIQSMSRKGNCWDNACVESFFGSLKQEGCGHFFESFQQARRDVFHYIEVFYNRQRLHSTLGYLSPLHFEQRRIS